MMATLKSGEVIGPYDCVMFAIGRHPVTSSLGLESTGATVDKLGRVRVDDYQWTGIEGLYCLGDASTSGYELTPVAIAAGRYAAAQQQHSSTAIALTHSSLPHRRLADRLFGGMEGAKLEYKDIPTVVFSQYGQQQSDPTTLGTSHNTSLSHASSLACYVCTVLLSG